MTRKIWLVGCVYVLVIGILSACGARERTTNILDVTAIESTAREIIRQTEAAIPTITPSPTITQTITTVYFPTEVPPATSTINPTVTQTATLAPTRTPSARVYMDGDTNCRSGPSNHYDWLGYIFRGESAYIVGKAADLDYWLIENPDADGECWVWGGYATVEGDTSQIPNKRIPPTKTPTKTATPTLTPAARFYLEEVISCNGQPSLIIRVYNAGRVTFQSFRMIIYHEPDRIEISRFSSNQFANDDQECALSVSKLDPFKTGYAVAPFDPNGYNDYSVDIQVCTGPGSRGGCVYEFYGFDKYFLTATPTYTPTATRTPTPTATATPTPTTPTP